MGDFETHITVAPTAANKWEALSQWGRARGLKCVHIVLERGQTASQPMFTSQSTGTLESELETAQRLCRECEDAGFQVARLKLEVPPWNPGVPQRQEEVEQHPNHRYFEHHIKLLLPANVDLDSLKEAVAPHDAHLSRNARRLREDGLQECFVTQRCKRVTRDEADTRLQNLLRSLQTFGFPVLETEAEFVVYDSNLALDAGWIEPTVKA